MRWSQATGSPCAAPAPDGQSPLKGRLLAERTQLARRRAKRPATVVSADFWLENAGGSEYWLPAEAVGYKRSEGRDGTGGPASSRAWQIRTMEGQAQRLPTKFRGRMPLAAGEEEGLFREPLSGASAAEATRPLLLGANIGRKARNEDRPDSNIPDATAR